MNSTTKNAAVLPYWSYQGKDYYALALERNGTLSTFGGGKHKGETSLKAAARECKEESLGIFGKYKKIKKTISSSGKVVLNKNDTTKTYVARFNWKHTDSPMDRFAKRRSQPGLTGAQKEITKVVRISRTKLKDAVQRAQGGQLSVKGKPVRGCVARTLKQALNEGKL